MKRILLFVICVFLCGCNIKVNEYNDLDDVFAAEQDGEKIRVNNYTPYIDYYLPSDLYEKESGLFSSTFTYDKSEMIMNVNVSGIIGHEYYRQETPFSEGFFDEGKRFYSHSGLYNNNDILKEYQFDVYHYEERYLLYFISEDLIFYAYADETDLFPLSSRILLMAKGADVKEETIIAELSTKNVIDYEKKQINLFDTIMPVNGVINDFIIEENDAANNE